MMADRMAEMKRLSLEALASQDEETIRVETTRAGIRWAMGTRHKEAFDGAWFGCRGALHDMLYLIAEVERLVEANGVLYDLSRRREGWAAAMREALVRRLQNCSICGGEGQVLMPEHEPSCDGQCLNCPVGVPVQCDACHEPALAPVNDAGEKMLAKMAADALAMDQAEKILREIHVELDGEMQDIDPPYERPEELCWKWSKTKEALTALVEQLP